MADILIKNMEMPKEGNVFLIISEDGCVSERIGNMWHVTTEAVALPSHGDLIDADVLDEKIKKLWFIPKQTKTEYMVAVEKTIATAPTIVEATE